MRCQGTNKAAEMISTTAAPNRSWHLEASEICNCRIRLNMQPPIVSAYTALVAPVASEFTALSELRVVWYDSSTQDNLTAPQGTVELT